MKENKTKVCARERRSVVLLDEELQMNGCWWMFQSEGASPWGMSGSSHSTFKKTKKQKKKQKQEQNTKKKRKKEEKKQKKEKKKKPVDVLIFREERPVSLEVCSHYNKGSGLFGACTFKERCTKVHICQHFVQDDCIFGAKCKRLHSVDEYSRRMLEERGLSSDIIQDLPYLYQNVYHLNSHGLDRERIASLSERPLAQAEEKSEICIHFIRRNCRFQEQCKRVHFNLPYKWEVYEGDGWRDLRGMEEIERAYCDPKNAHSPGSKPVDFLSMTRVSDPVRRLSTASSVTKPAHYILTTQWLWYYKGDHENWIEYGRPDDKQRVTSVTSRDLEEAFLTDNTADVTVIKGNRHYFVSFQDMYQRNPKHNTKRRVRRRPRFVSISEVESKVAQSSSPHKHPSTYTY